MMMGSHLKVVRWTASRDCGIDLQAGELPTPGFSIFDLRFSIVTPLQKKATRGHVRTPKASRNRITSPERLCAAASRDSTPEIRRLRSPRGKRNKVLTRLWLFGYKRGSTRKFNPRLNHL